MSVFFLYEITWIVSIYIHYSRNIYRWECHYVPPARRIHFQTKAEPPFEILWDKSDDIPDKKLKLFSASLYGQKDVYLKGAVRMANNIKTHFNDWNLIIFVHEDVDASVKNDLRHHGAIIMEVRDPIMVPGNSSGMFWRFMPMAWGHKCIVSDVDSTWNVLTFKKFINAWDKSGQSSFRYMDKFSFPWPKNHIKGGYFGFSGLTLDEKEIQNPGVRSRFGSDEIFLAYRIIPELYKKGIVTLFPSHFAKVSYILSPSHIPSKNNKLVVI